MFALAMVLLALSVGAAIYHFTGRFGASSEAKAEEAPKPDAQVVLKTEVDTFTWSDMTTEKAKEKYRSIAGQVKSALDEKKPYIEVDGEEILVRTEDFRQLVEWDSHN